MTPLQWVQLAGAAWGVGEKLIEAFADDHPELRDAPTPLDEGIEEEYRQKLAKLRRERMNREPTTLPPPPLDTDPAPTSEDA